MGIHKVLIQANPSLFKIIDNPYTLSFEIEGDGIADKETKISIKTAQKLIQLKADTRDGVSITCFVSFDNGAGQTRQVEVSEKVFADFLKNCLDNEATRYLFRRYEDMFIDSEQADKEFAVSVLPLEDEILQREFMRDFHKKLLGSLSPTEYKRVYMYYFQNLNYSQIAEREHVSVSTVHESISYAIKKMKSVLEHDKKP